MSRALVIAVLLVVPGLARADTLYWLGAKLPNGATYDDGGGDPMLFYVDETQSTPGGLPVANVEQEVRAAYQRWQDVSCAYIGFKFAGAVTDPSQLGAHDDSKNVMASFVSDATDPRYTDDLGAGVAVGVALTYRNNGVILGCDTEYNAHDYQYSDGLPVTEMDFPSLANHETGHCLGLDHDPDDFDSVMYPTVVNGDERRTLDAHDVDNVCQLYPETGALGSPCAGTSCSSGLSCILNPTAGGNFCSQVCTAADPSTCPTGFGCRTSTAIAGAAAACFPGTGDFSPDVGQPCVISTDCNGANATCIDAADNPAWSGGYCSQACAANSDCPNGSEPGGDVCANLGSASYCTAPCTTYAGGCRDGYACVGLDTLGDGFCYPACEADADCNGWLCLGDGVCYPPGNGGSWVGHACFSRTDCPTGDFCIPGTDSSGAPTGWTAGYCSGPCGGGQNADRGCGAGAACVVAGAEGQAYCLQSCDANGGCRSGYTCVVKPGSGNVGEQVCAPGCSADTDCAVGESCLGGACVDPDAVDGGASCLLCGDGGVVHTTSGTSGTTGGTTQPAAPSGCGCGTSGGLDVLAGLALALAALSSRSKRW